MARRSGISHRWSVLPKTHDNGSPVEPGGFYAEDNFPPTSVRMQLYADAAPTLALEAIRTLSQQANISGITHLIVASCTGRSEEHTSELQSIMRISYAVFCLKKKKQQ